MTAEIAVLNKSAVALATDSAGTIGGGGETKIYNTVNKIFELSASEPVGIMIYGSLDFMGLPFETIIKQYRDKLGRNKFDHISGYVKDFTEHLCSIPHDERDERINILRILIRPLQQLNRNIDRAVIENAAKDGKYKRSKVNGIVQKQIRSLLSIYRARTKPDGFYKKRPVELIERISPIFEQAIDESFEFNFSAVNQSLLMKLCEEILLKCPMSNYRTGIVIAGFGDKEICPTLESVEVDGIIGGVLKVNSHKMVDIGRYTTGADVLGFAQDDMVERFINGVDPAYNRYVSTAVKRLFDKLSSDLKQGGGDPQAHAALETVFDRIRLDLEKDLSQYREVTFRRPTIDLVRFMPKPDLAKLAESMIELTSLKRRVSWDQDTVGGDVDVAVISKSEGFVWIKRKHYFPRDLNPRFFHRLTTSDNGGE